MYSRTPSGTEDVLTFAPTGWTYDQTFVLYDHQTESLWYQLNPNVGMRCVNGFYEGKLVAELSSWMSQWNVWKAAYPHTKFMCKSGECKKSSK